MTPQRSGGTLPVLFGVIILDLIGFGIVLPVLPFWAEHHGASAVVLGLLLTCYAGMQFIFAPIWGRVSDRIGRRPVMLLTVAGSGLALLMLGMAGSLVWLFAARILGGVFAANISVATAYVADVTGEDERTKWMGMIGASFGVGFLVGPAIGGLLAPYGYGVPMLAAAGLAAINLVFAMFVLREPPTLSRAAASRLDRAQLLANTRVRQLCLANFTFSFAVSQLEAVFAFFMMDRFDYDAREVAFILVMMAVVMAAIQGGAIRALAARLSEKRLVVGGALLMGLAFAAVPWMPSVALLLIPLAISAVGRAICQPSMLSLVSLAASPSTRGSVLGTFQSAASLARVVGPVIAGALYELSTETPFILASLLMAATAVVGARFPRVLRSPPG